MVPSPQYKADKGSLVHKALELLARKKLAIQQGEATFSESEIGRSWDTTLFLPDNAFQEAWSHYTKTCSHWEWTGKDRKEIRKWFDDTLAMNDGMWNPLNRKVVAPEQYFDFVIEEPWAKYNYALPDGRRIEGYLGLKGAVDLVTEVDENTLEYCDYKSGARKDWATGAEKDWKKLRDDPQLRIYHYALSRLFPQYSHIIMSILFLRDGGPFSLPFGQEDLPKTEGMLRDRFEIIRACQRPPRIIHDREHKWKCSRLCTFGMSYAEDGKTTVCQSMHNELMEVGIDRVTAKYAKGNFQNYGSGGGVADRDKK